MVGLRAWRMCSDPHPHPPARHSVFYPPANLVNGRFVSTLNRDGEVIEVRKTDQSSCQWSHT